MNRRMESFLLVLFILQSSVFVSGFLFSRKICYDHIGCFSNASPYNNANGKLPESPAHIQTEFLLYTRQNPTHEFQLNPYDASTIGHSHFDGSKQTLFITHGYQDDGRSDWIVAMTRELLKKDDMNVIAVNWANGADNINYIQAAANTRVVGATIGELLKTLHSTGHSNYNKFHLVGHSLGSHISGYAGAYVHGAIAKITGLDPAGPLFENKDPKTRLDPSDAHYVEAIHTDGDSLFQLGFGLEKAIGHADFYPNGGEKQPGCSRDVGTHLFSLITGKIEKFTSTIACSHMRVLDLFTESINSQCTFSGKPCHTKKDFDAGHCTRCGLGCADMGYNSHQKGHGKYYFSTSSAGPFCQ
ncbi:pancreatic triacylglycerol lipase-like [Mytilus galloprovincialis]|uniref:pancreatic triacylglycerol lipase-like n=1 Tax=Mytilus galloprovincialis TaxID=29158 RepID=UPI003F7BDBF1